LRLDLPKAANGDVQGAALLLKVDLRRLGWQPFRDKPAPNLHWAPSLALKHRLQFAALVGIGSIVDVLRFAFSDMISIRWQKVC
jgi:hypothetical protein